MGFSEEIRILVIEDEPKLRQAVGVYLSSEGYGFSQASGGLEGLRLFRSEKFDLVLLDLMLPGMSGESVAEEIRKISDVPIIMLTAKTELDAKIKGFRIGADDYVTKPFDPGELMERIKAVLRRSRPESETMKVRVPWAELWLDEATRRAGIGEREVVLTQVEFDLLLILARRPGWVFSREQLMEAVFGPLYDGMERTVDAHIKNIRKKIEANSSDPRIVLTVFGVGYKVRGREQP